MKRRLIRCAAAVLLAGHFAAISSGAELRKVWDVDLAQAIRPDIAPGFDGLPVLAVRFSPDGRQIAVLAGKSRVDGRDVSSLLIFRTDRTADSVRRFEIRGVHEDRLELPSVIMWSREQDAVIVGQTVVRVESGASCRLPENSTSGFLDSMHIFTWLFRSGQPKLYGSNPAIYEFFGPDCRSIGTAWDGKTASVISDISLDGRLVCIRESDSGIVSIIDPFNDRTVTHWAKKTHLITGARFANSGDVICGAGSPSPDGNFALQCLNVKSGNVIAETPSISGGAISTSERATRVVADDVRSVKSPFSYERGTILKRRVVWDFKTNKELVSWGPATQSYRDPSFSPPMRIRAPFKVALSPDGEYVAEGGNGMLHFYKIIP